MNQQQFEHIALRLRQIAVGYARRYIDDSDDANDAASDTMLKLWAVHDSLHDNDHAARLAAVISRNVAIDMVRKRTATIVRMDDVGASRLGARFSSDSSPDGLMEWREDEQWLARRIAQLPPREMQVLRLRQTERRTNEEIAAIMGIKKESVATVLSAARRKLFNDLKERNRR